jgi:hypothetical protein
LELYLPASIPGAHWEVLLQPGERTVVLVLYDGKLEVTNHPQQVSNPDIVTAGEVRSIVKGMAARISAWEMMRVELARDLQVPVRLVGTETIR